MPDPTSQGARLFLRKRPGRNDVYIIRETGQPERSTRTADRAEAEKQLAQYIIERRQEDRSVIGAAEPSRMTIGEVLMIYGEEHAPTTRSPERIGYQIERLIQFWAHLTVDSIKGETCRRYVKWRKEDSDRRNVPCSVSTVRQELSCLRAAQRYCAREGYLTRDVRVTLPPAARSKDRYLSVTEAAWILRAARHEMPHLARFFLLGWYTGTRKEATLALSWMPQLNGGWIDADEGVLFRMGTADTESKKRRPRALMPQKLLAHCRRWAKDGHRWPIHYGGKRIGEIGMAWTRNLRKAERMAAAAGVEIDLTGVTPHTLRHSAITHGIQAGMSMSEAAEFFGASVVTIEKTYWHHHPEFQKNAARAMDRRAR